MTVRAGRLRHRLEVYRPTNERDEFGTVTAARELVGRFWCDAKNMSNETLIGDIRQNQDTVEFTTRYNKQLGDIKNDMFIEFKGNEFDILSVVNPRLLNEYIVIRCVKRG